MGGRRLLIFWFLVVTAILAIIIPTSGGEASTPTTSSQTSGCAAGGIDRAGIDRAMGPAGMHVNIEGHASIPMTSTITVRFDGRDIGSIPVDLLTGEFQGTLAVPEGIPDGLYSFDLISNHCDRTRLVLCVGDSVAEGSFASGLENTYAYRVLSGLRQRYGDSSWNLQVYGASGYGSLMLDDVFNTPFYLDALNAPPYFSPRVWWKNAYPDLVIIEVGVNNLPGLDRATRYDGSLRGYGSDAEALSWWKHDVAVAVGYLTTFRSVSPSHILVLGQWPFGSAASYRGERYTGGTSEAVWDQWNTEMQSQAAALGVTFVPMADVYGAGYIPDSSRPGGDPLNLVDHLVGNSNVHPNDAGMALFADRILGEVPQDANGGLYSSPFEVRMQSPLAMPVGLSINSAYWGSYGDFLARQLSVDFDLRNESGDVVADMRIEDSPSTNGVICVSALPLLAGNLPFSGETRVTLKYEVPNGVSAFRSTLAATAVDPGGWTHRY